MSLAKVLELLALEEKSLSELCEEVPTAALVHERAPVPWSLKGLAMRELSERVRENRVDLADGIRIEDDGGWAQLVPDPGRALLPHLRRGAHRPRLGGAREEVSSAARGGSRGRRALTWTAGNRFKPFRPATGRSDPQALVDPFPHARIIGLDERVADPSGSGRARRQGRLHRPIGAPCKMHSQTLDRYPTPSSRT